MSGAVRSKLAESSSRKIQRCPECLKTDSALSEQSVAAGGRCAWQPPRDSLDAPAVLRIASAR